jgi:2-polyprenyl-3-methyl-5-hydroxy-6-metoxy-1,4-benzoquinol methylase
MQPTIPLDYLDKNKASWNKRTGFHLDSEFYDQAGFLQGNTSLNSIELGKLGDIRGKTILHLQCHFGQDSLSMARMGAKVTGIDLSDKAIDQAKRMNEELKLDAEFICCNVYDLPAILNKQFDLVYTSYGAIVWLPDLMPWAKLIAGFLKPGGKLVLVEFHPALWMFDAHFKEVKNSYFNSGASIETETGTYADRSADIEHECITWNHSLAEVMGSLLNSGMKIVDFEEYDYSPYNCILETEQIAPRKYRIKHLGNKLPMCYSLVASSEKA